MSLPSPSLNGDVGSRKKGCVVYTYKRHHKSLLLFTSVILILSMFVGCSPSPEDLAAVDYTPLPGDDWEVSSLEEEGLDPDREDARAVGLTAGRVSDRRPRKTGTPRHWR